MEVPVVSYISIGQAEKLSVIASEPPQHFCRNGGMRILFVILGLLIQRLVASLVLVNQ